MIFKSIIYAVIKMISKNIINFEKKGKKDSPLQKDSKIVLIYLIAKVKSG